MTGRVSSSRARLSGLPRVPVLLHCHARAYPGLPDTQPSRRYGRAGWITWHSLSCPASASAGNPCPPGEAWTRGSRLPPSVLCSWHRAASFRRPADVSMLIVPELRAAMRTPMRMLQHYLLREAAFWYNQDRGRWRLSRSYGGY